MKLLLKLSLVFLLNIGFLMPQSLEEYDKKIEQQNYDRTKLEKEISRLQKDIKASSSRASSLLDELDQSEKQISLIEKRINNLSTEIKLRKEKLSLLKMQRSQKEELKDSLLVRYEKRVVRGYKSHSNDVIQLLFSADGLKQFYYRLKYLNAINQSERKLFWQIKDLIQSIEQQSILILKENRDISKRINGLSKEKAQVKKLVAKRKRRLQTIQNDKSLFTRLIKEKENSLQKIQQFISDLLKKKQERLVELERQRALHSITITDANSFKALRGQLPWPASGKIVGHFGKHKHPVLKTITENTGIDIKVKNNPDVQSIMDGLVTTVTWLRGYGNTIIIHHGEDYYTVYTKVNNVLVTENEYVTSGQNIAQVSPNSIDGNILHFEIWDSQKKLNPEKWLRP